MDLSHLSPKDKIEALSALQQTMGWALLSAELEATIQVLSNDISNAIRKKDFEHASRLDGKKEMAELLKNLPARIKRKNETVIERVKNLIPGNRG